MKDEFKLACVIVIFSSLTAMSYISHNPKDCITGSSIDARFQQKFVEGMTPVQEDSHEP